jgi:competence ComEA-like helix-hairpin-helix protein
MGWKEFTSDYLSFTRKDRIAILVIITLITGIFLLPSAIKSAKQKPVTADTSWMVAMQKLEKQGVDSQRRYNNYDNDNNSNAYQYDRPTGNNYSKTKGELFYFDPNTISAEGWQRLGIREKTIHTIQNYLSKGGKFRQPEDVQRIYGLFPNEYERIAPYIKIEQNGNTGYSNNSYPAKTTEYNNQPPKPAVPRYAAVDINAADTSAFIALPGIGSKLAARIINFRDKLGGFYSVAQVGETFGLPDSTFQKIKQYLNASTMPVKKININTTTIDELKMHPYIKWGIANPVIAYRKEHGNFARVEDIKNVMAVTDEVYNKIAPYLTTN